MTLFEEVVKVFSKDRKVMRAKMFGAPGLKIGRKMFAMYVEDKLAIKLPKERVDTLITLKKGERFYHLFDKSRLMKEWVVIGQKNKHDWTKLVKEARNFVASTKNNEN